MGSKNYSNAILSKYFLKMGEANKEIPYMTEISKQTGVSNATISRYAKKRGFYNFGEMRATFNKTLTTTFAEIDLKGFDEIFSHKNIKIATSKSTEIMGEFLRQRLRFRNIAIEIVDKDTVWNKDDFTLFISLTGESQRIKDYIKKSIGHKMIIATKESDLPKDVKQIVLHEYSLEIRNTYDIANSMLRIVTWMNEIINIKEIQLDNEK